MGYSYNMETSKKDNRSTISLSACHLMFNIINLFISTFLVAHIYSLTDNLYSYAFNVGVFQLSTYACMLVSYFLFSFVVDKTNRVWIYRIANIIEAILVLITIFYGKDLAKIVILAGLLNGLSHGAYYASYNVLKQEMVSRKSMDKFIIVITVLSKVVNVVCPILLGALIEVSSFSMVAIYVLILATIQTILSFFIKAKRPEDSNFNLKNYFKKLKKPSKINKKIKFLYKIVAIYGLTSIVSMLLKINIMMQFGSNFSLGTITSIFSVVAIITLLLMKRFTKYGKRFWLFIATGSLQIVGTVIFVIMPNMVTLIIYYFFYAICEIINGTICDLIRNKNFKENGMYQDIAEHQCVVESLLQITRIISFALLMLVSTIHSYIAYQIFFVVVMVVYTIMSLMLMLYERKDNNDKF